MNIRLAISLLFISALLIAGCKKKGSSSNPCEGLMNEMPPTQIGVKFLEKTTGENLILSKNLKAADINVINTNTGKPIINWGIVNVESSTSPLNGMLRFSIFNETVGQYPYQIKLGDLGTFTLGYAVTKKSTDDPCRPAVYQIGDVKIIDHPFKVLNHEGKDYPNMLVIEL